MTDDLDLDLAVGVVFCRAGLVRLIETAALGRFDQGGQFLSHLLLKLSYFIVYEPSATGVRCKTIEKIGGPTTSTRSSEARTPSDRMRSAIGPALLCARLRGEDKLILSAASAAFPPSNWSSAENALPHVGLVNQQTSSFRPRDASRPGRS